METEGVRLNKFLSEAGVCSRREADRQIDAGNVLINGKMATMGQRVMEGDVVEFQGKEIFTKPKPVLLLCNKPEGIVCTAEKKERNNIVDYIHYPVRLYPVGRLDKNSRGLLLMTNQGELVNRIMRARNYHEKEYIVRLDKPITGAFITDMAKGVFLPELEVKTRPCQVEKLSKYTFRIVLTQGLNRQIRRMCQVLGYHVRDLQRVRIMNLTLDGIKEGEYREIRQDEYEELISMLGE